MKKRAFNPERSRMGFTLIELLIVIAIIGILAVIVVMNLLTAQLKARDTKRKSDIKTIASALEAYKSQIGTYPSGSCTGTGIPTDVGGVTFCPVGNIAVLNSELVGKNYLPTMPTDPKPVGNRGYYYYSNGKNFKLISNSPELIKPGDSNCAQIAGDFAETNIRLCADYQVNSNSEATKSW